MKVQERNKRNSWKNHLDYRSYRIYHKAKQKVVRLSDENEAILILVIFAGLPAARNPWGGNRVDGIPSLLLTTARPIGRLLDFDLLQEQQLPPMLY